MARLYAPFVPTPEAVTHAMLSAAGCGTADTVVDLGCGDARLLLSALSPPYSCKAAVGVDLDEALLAQARATADGLGLSPRLKLVHAELLDYVSSAGVLPVQSTADEAEEQEKEEQERVADNGIDTAAGTIRTALDPLSEATIISCFLSPQAMEDLRPCLALPRPGCRLVALDFPVPGVHPNGCKSLMGMDIYMYDLGEGLVYDDQQTPQS